jgi:tyrosinase
MEEPAFEEAPESSGFSAALENVPHGNVHVSVGGIDDIGFPVGDMGSTTTAGRDPIFWLHHSNVDRLWESWLRSGGETTANYRDRPWHSQKWPFIDEQGRRQDVSLKDFEDMTKDEPIGYEKLENIRRRPPPPAGLAAARVAESAASPPIILSPRGNRLGMPSLGPAMAARRPQTVSSARIVIENASTSSEIGIIFDVFLNLPEGRSADPTYHVGSFQFFGLVHEGMQHPRRFVFDVTERVRAQMAAGAWPGTPTITILPRRTFAGSPARVGSARLIIE